MFAIECLNEVMSHFNTISVRDSERIAMAKKMDPDDWWKVSSWEKEAETIEAQNTLHEIRTSLYHRSERDEI